MKMAKNDGESSSKKFTIEEFDDIGEVHAKENVSISLVIISDE